MATSGNNPRGFVPTRTLRGDSNFRTTIYATLGGNLNQLFKGDLVFLDALGRPQLVTGVSAGSTAPIGVVAAVYDANKRAKTHALPSGHIGADVSATNFVEVYDDPDIVFTVQADTSVGPGFIGNYVAVTANAPSTAAGRSGQIVAIADLTTSALGHPLQIIGIAPNEMDELGGANNDIEVVISHHKRRPHPLTPLSPSI